MAVVKKRSASPRFGAHLSIAGGVENAIRAALDLRFDTVQVFVKNQRQWRAKPLADESVAAWHALHADHSDFGPVVAHGTYLINLASGDKTLQERSYAAFVDELLRCDQLAIPYLVFHPGAAKDDARNVALRRVARMLSRALRAHPELEVMPLLETTAGQGTTLGATLEELSAIIEQVAQPERVGVCFDSCHVFAAGYDIRDPETYESMVARADELFGVDRIRCWHLNDSQQPLGSRRDRHAEIGQGCIGFRGFRHIVRDPRFAGLPMVIETPKGEDERGRDLDVVNVGRLRRMRR